MEACILFAHGSLLCGSGEALESHASRLRENHCFSLVATAYLNYSSPTLLQAVESCRQAGCADITVVPYFLAPGYFVNRALPDQIQAAQTTFPDVRFTIARAIEFHERLADAILALAGEPLRPEHWNDDLDSAVKSCRAFPDCPLFAQPSCPRPIEPREPAIVTAPDSAKTALVVMAHGSPRPEANEPFYRVLDVIRARNRFERVEAAFLECNEPLIGDMIDRCVAAGSERIVAVPYFLHTGTHVAEDLPNLLDDARKRHKRVEILLGRYVGLSPILSEVLYDRARECQAVA